MSLRKMLMLLSVTQGHSHYIVEYDECDVPGLDVVCCELVYLFTVIYI